MVRWWPVTVSVDQARDLPALHAAIRAGLGSVPDHGRPTIVRLTLHGRSPLHGALQDMSLRLRDDVRSIAAELPAELWIEKLRVATSPTAEAEGAGSEIGALIPPPDATLLAAMQAEFGKFLGTIPHDMLHEAADGDGGLLHQARQGEWAALLHAAHAALLHRLEDAA